MATIRKEIAVEAAPEAVWDALRDFYAVHTRLVPGFVVDLKPEPGTRIVTFSNGTVARELLVTCDDAARRLVYAVVSERLKQHSAAVEVVTLGTKRSKVVWTVDVLPDAVAGYIDAQMSAAVGVMKHTLEQVGQGQSQGARLAVGG